MTRRVEIGEEGDVRATLAVLLMTGCVGGSFDPLPGQDKAIEVVWHGLYGETGEPPPIEWFAGTGSLPGTTDIAGLALAGWKIQVAIESATCVTGEHGEESFDCSIGSSELAHELMHAHTYNRTGDIDALHWRGDWRLSDVTAKIALWDARL